MHDPDRADGHRPQGWTVNTRQQEQPTPYLRALETAHALGRADGLLAVRLEMVEEPDATSSWCHGLDPDDFAGHVWGAGAGSPPAGVRLNAPRWYAHGFHEAVASARAQRGCRPASDTRSGEHRQPAGQERAVVVTPSELQRDHGVSGGGALLPVREPRHPINPHHGVRDPLGRRSQGDGGNRHVHPERPEHTAAPRQRRP